MKFLKVVTFALACTLSSPVHAADFQYDDNMLYVESQLNRGGRYERGTVQPGGTPALYGHSNYSIYTYKIRVFFRDCTVGVGCNGLELRASFDPKNLTRNAERLAAFSQAYRAVVFVDNKGLLRVSRGVSLEEHVSKRDIKTAIRDYLRLLGHANEELFLPNIQREDSKAH